MSWIQMNQILIVAAFAFGAAAEDAFLTGDFFGAEALADRSIACSTASEAISDAYLESSS